MNDTTSQVLKPEIMNTYKNWLSYATMDTELEAELISIKDDAHAIEDAFYRELEFGTGGLRGVIGAGTNRMNVYTVGKASQGLSNYIKKNFKEEDWKIAVSRDSRINSDLFAQVASGVFAANGIHVYIYEDIMPTPCLSFAVRELNCVSGIMVTASHNPAKYNGYKVYDKNGCQITTEAAAEILSEIEKLDVFKDVKFSDYKAGIESGNIEIISADIYTRFVDCVKAQSVLGADEEIDRDVSIVYTPLHGTGREPVLRTLRETGFTHITVVKEQEEPDGHFTTCPYPNPEIREAMEEGIKTAKKVDADLLIATDPDCDRVGIAVKNESGDFTLLSGNETGMLLLDYILMQRTKHGTLPADPVLVKTIVTIDMGALIAEHYGVRTIDVLTGFKFIGEQIGRLEQEGKADSYVFGFEESYGYLSGSYVRDKDAVDGAFLICEMFSYYKTHGISLLEKLDELYKTYGYCLNTLHSFEFDGAAGFSEMQKIMKDFHTDVKVANDDTNDGNTTAFGGHDIEKVLDYSKGLDGLPKSDVLKYLLSGHCSVVIRPSGTEPKLKAYISVSADSMEKAAEIEKLIMKDLTARFKA